jgi:hypothetical protein
MMERTTVGQHPRSDQDTAAKRKHKINVSINLVFLIHHSTSRLTNTNSCDKSYLSGGSDKQDPNYANKSEYRLTLLLR